MDATARKRRPAGRRWLLWLVLFGCTRGREPEGAWERPDPSYRPGQSITESRRCECVECVRASCCSGDPGIEEDTSSELGMSIGVCGRCVRRVWPARAGQACAERAPETCCAGSIQG